MIFVRFQPNICMDLNAFFVWIFVKFRNTFFFPVENILIKIYFFELLIQIEYSSYRMRNCHFLLWLFFYWYFVIMIILYSIQFWSEFFKTHMSPYRKVFNFIHDEFIPNHNSLTENSYTIQLHPLPLSLCLRWKLKLSPHPRWKVLFDVHQ